jgi:hypothetical protein
MTSGALVGQPMEARNGAVCCSGLEIGLSMPMSAPVRQDQALGDGPAQGGAGAGDDEQVGREFPRGDAQRAR